MPRLRSRNLAPILALAALAAGACSDADAVPDASPTAGATDLYAALNDVVAAIADQQAALAPPMAELLSGLLAVDGAVADLRDPDRVDDAVEAWPPVPGGLDGSALDGVRTSARELAADVDQARAELAGTRSDDDPWEVRYRDAQDRVLVAVRAYAQASDELAQVLAMHLPTYQDVVARSATFVEQRSRYRSAQEASDAYEVEIGRLLDDLATARQQVSRFVAQRDDAAAAMNAASAAAADVWAERPGAVP